ncbi:MAG TPA: fluoride efflux transporter CrcB [Candidatus Acidoferrum sp.]|nr:fluoride efflux transporter CrcB [Candidatus Acidoferrum sp.]
MSVAWTVMGRSIFMLMYLWVAIGGALGSVSRYWLSGFVATRVGETFPWGTIVINVTGSFIIGLFASLTGPEGRWLVPSTFRTFFMVGICGGYTTFSSFSLQTLNLANEGEWARAGLNVLLSVTLCLAGVWLGWLLANQLNQLK